MIRIISQDGCHQYDEDYNEITTWDDKKCAWIVNPEYENEEIDWWGEDNDFPAGYTLAEYERNYPDWNSRPDIDVIWTWDEDGYKKAFPDWRRHPIPSFPETYCRSWGYLDISEEEAINRLGRHCRFNQYAISTKVTYNGKIIYDGKLD